VTVLRCSKCGKRLLRAYASSGGSIYGPTCANNLGIKPDAPKPVPLLTVTPHRAVKRQAVAQWGQLVLEFAT
jgi:phage FluMu protein Com